MDNVSTLNLHLATRLRDLRAENGLTLEGLAERTGVSRSMISLIERGESSPTAAVFDKLAAGLGVTLASLFAEKDSQSASPLARRADQRVWRDPDSGYMRRNLSAPGFASPIELVEVVLPPGARVAYDTGHRASAVHQQIWIVEGEIDRPAVIRAEDGAELPGELWRLSPLAVSRLLRSISAPLALGEIELADGSSVLGFTASVDRTERDITGFGGWRAFRAASSQPAVA